jgi:cleavage stimulation factor subunit 3
MEYINGNFDELEGLFTRCLKSNLSVPLWKLYLSYVRNHQLPKILDESEARQTMLKAYDFAVGHIGLDVRSGPIWKEYLEYAQSNYYKLVYLNYFCFITQLLTSVVE